MAPLPTPVRAALGLAAITVEQARTLPDRVLELPVLAVSTALQFSVRAQQRYAEWALRGDEMLSRLHEPPDEPPSWATFDDEVAPAEPAADSVPSADSVSAGASEADSPGRPAEEEPGHRAEEPPEHRAEEPLEHRAEEPPAPTVSEPSRSTTPTNSD